MAYPPEITFEAYCLLKKIDMNRFREIEPDKFDSWNELFNTISPESFTQQKLYLINDTRRKYPLKNNAEHA